LTTYIFNTKAANAGSLKNMYNNYIRMWIKQVYSGLWMLYTNVVEI